MAVSAYEVISAQTLGSAVASTTFSSIPQYYTDLVLVMTIQKSTSNGGYLSLRFNGDTTANYSSSYFLGDGASGGTGRLTGETFGRIGNGGTSNFELTRIFIQNYANATTQKTALSRSDVSANYVISYVSLWRKTPEAITSITILPDSGNFNTGSIFTLYGIKAA
jgi:hypothetical protein